MTKLPILYSRNSNGSINQWEMNIDESSYFSIEGMVGGRLTTNNPTVCVQKNVGRANQTSIQEQAHAEGVAKWKKKKKEGYRENIDEIDNTGLISPQLAKNFEDYREKVKYPVGVQIKFNGFCCLVNKAGAWTRKNERYVSIPHIEKSLKDFFIKFPNALLHGELFNFDYRERLNLISKLCRKTVHVTAEDLKSSEELIRYYIYDGYNLNSTIDSHYLDRAKAIETELSSNPYYRKVETKIANSEEEVFEIYNEIISDRHEGVIVRDLNSPYVHVRTKNVLKIKPLNDSDGMIISFVEGLGNWSKSAKKAKMIWRKEVSLKNNDIEFDATMVGTYEELKKIFDDPIDWIGKTVKFHYNGLTGKGEGKPNYGRIDILNCSAEK